MVNRQLNGGTDSFSIFIISLASLSKQCRVVVCLVVLFASRNYIQTAFAPTIARGGDINDAMRIPRCQNRQ
ncbi:uncharacterized protein ASPGLDRAFT_1123335 [Aspergillus glaucus CBS 516.65]|uniref:Uncharacterized protein n=1 Tax=Aspergillus glaucus CBS 516.65 TaxID=1160497 RepID=A0A1L9VT38_ASPGL|nr:hypothetical protein ASPGLDRAFT_1123335 [Aspergillus glaucus CBS 516.65]OJJ87069.1 hypothetical protein ASPGLDRAFT_1123335 [Aspergillus glaucus CBS 516.65]